MTFSYCSEPIRKRWCVTHRPCKPLHHSIQFKAPVEPPGEGTEVTPKMSGMNRMIGTSQGILNVTQHRIDPVELGHFNTGRSTTSGDAVVRADRSNCTKAVQPVRDHFTVRRQVTSIPFADRLAAEALDRGHTHTQWPAIARAGHSCDTRGFTQLPRVPACRRGVSPPQKASST